jgi:hypothetical protein
MNDPAEPEQGVAEDPHGPGAPRREPRGQRATPVEVLKRVGLFLLITVLTLALLEGCASLVMAAFDGPDDTAELTYSQYDAELGWVNVPSIALPDLWGPRRGLLTNAQGFRAATDIAPGVAPGGIRIVCSGDSFAFGEGVGNEDTWCHLLTERDERIETVNLGQPGYGVDQSYLRYVRDGVPLAHDVHVFTFIRGDFDRAGRRSHYGYAKPIFRLDGDTLAVANVPVPRVLPAIARFSIRLSERLRIVEFAGRVLTRLSSRPYRPSPERLEGLQPVIKRIFQEVYRSSENEGSAVLFVYLPTLQDLEEEGPWRSWASVVLDSLGYSFFDLTPTLRGLSPEVTETLFIPAGAAGGGHYSRAGNAWAAEALYEQIGALLSSATEGVPLDREGTPGDSEGEPSS